MNLSIGIVGLPNVGKSTLFNALLKQQVALAANYPFATIEPNVGVVPVPDERLARLAEVVQSQKIVPAVVEFVDIAGLVKGASDGAGLGNKFLAHIRETLAICHVLRGFSDPDIIREGSQDPLSDLETIRTELQLADLATLEKQSPPKGSTSPADKKNWELVVRFKEAVSAGGMVRTVIHSDAERQCAQQLSLLTAKPELFAINVDEAQLADATTLQQQYAQQLRVAAGQVVIISAKVESELAALDAAEAQLFLAELGVSRSGLERLIQAAYATLGLQSYLTAGEKEVRAWTIRQGATAVEAAGEIHTDFMKKFIRANIASYADFVASGGWKGVREQGKLRTEGRDYLMRPDDVVEFLIGN